MSFHEGDRVIALVDYPEGNSYIKRGLCGTVLKEHVGYVSVRWDTYVAGHPCGGLCEEGFGWNVKEDEIGHLCFDVDEVV